MLVPDLLKYIRHFPLFPPITQPRSPPQARSSQSAPSFTLLLAPSPTHTHKHTFPTMPVLGGGIGGISVIIFGALCVVLAIICGIRMHRARKQADARIEQSLPGTSIISPRPYFEPCRYQPPTPASHGIDMSKPQDDTTTTGPYGEGVLPSYAAPSVPPPSYPVLAHVVTIPDAEETERNSLPLSTLPQASSGVAVAPSSQATPAVSAP